MTQYTGTDVQLLHLIKLDLITPALACDVQREMDATGYDALRIIWVQGLKHAAYRDSILDHYCAFMDAATKGTTT